MKKLKRPFPRCFYSSDLAYLMNHRTHRPSQLVYDCEFCNKDCDYRINESLYTNDKGLGMTAEDGVNIGAYIFKGMVEGMKQQGSLRGSDKCKPSGTIHYPSSYPISKEVGKDTPIFYKYEKDDFNHCQNLYHTIEGDKKSAVQTLIDDLTEKLENDPIKYMALVQKFRIGDYKVETFVTGETVIKITISNDDIYKYFYKEDTNS